ncbi:YeeE/YedE family protein [Salinimonas lutimaris]|uniref:YeeE/YedE family protein n=1 Tax=Salinimonas lutimaris TaxID=914153 RepID=UPI0010C0EA7E|nr:YeeE/YedE thiosulfate transporter family protein [Salinimonas lutimaris]
MNTALFAQAFIGGLLIGTGAVVLMLFNGRVAGISGITASALSKPAGQHLWRYAFLAGLVLAPFITAPLGYALPVPLPGDAILLAVAGLLVGIGTRLGTGCTSGHGICGLGRLSLRSLVATITFMVTAILTVLVLRLFS